MTALTDTGLGELQENYARVLGLTDHASALLSDLDRAGAAQAQYGASRFARIDDVVPGGPLAAVATALDTILGPVADQVVMRHESVPGGELSFGARFRRVDAACERDVESRLKLELLLDRLGFTAFGAGLGKALTPLIRRVVGDVTYRRAYLYLYREGDYIGAHDDHHVGNRIDVQFAVTLDGAGGIRVLSDGFFRMHYDVAGSMNILGPAMWHDVPQPLRVSPTATPRRLTIGLRFTPD